MGSREEGVRICTSFITEAQFPLFEERIRAFRAAQGQVPFNTKFFNTSFQETS
jgi:hypothetical protein